MIGQNEQLQSFQDRFRFLYGILIVMASILFLRLWYLQILKGEEFKRDAEENRLKKIKIEAPRGMVFDRERRVLLDNHPTFNVAITPQYFRAASADQRDATIEKLSHIINVPANYAEMVEKTGQRLSPCVEVNGVMRSDDHGETWTDVSKDLIRLAQQPHLKSKIVSNTYNEGMLDSHAIAISPSDPDGVVLAVRMGLFHTADAGETWQDMEVGRFSPNTYGRDVKASPHDKNTVFCALSVAAASKDGGVYKSSDAGKTWKRFDKVKVHGTIMSIGLHHSDPKQVYIGARYDGEVFGTQDGGASWQAMPLPGEVQHIYAIACG